MVRTRCNVFKSSCTINMGVMVFCDAFLHDFVMISGIIGDDGFVYFFCFILDTHDSFFLCCVRSFFFFLERAILTLNLFALGDVRLPSPSVRIY